MSKTPPLENLGLLTKARVPLLHVCDKTDPWFDDYTRVVEQRFKELGGQITIVTNANDAHAPLAAAERNRVIDLIVAKTK